MEKRIIMLQIENMILSQSNRVLTIIAIMNKLSIPRFIYFVQLVPQDFKFLEFHKSYISNSILVVSSLTQSFHLLC